MSRPRSDSNALSGDHHPITESNRVATRREGASSRSRILAKSPHSFPRAGALLDLRLLPELPLHLPNLLLLAQVAFPVRVRTGAFLEVTAMIPSAFLVPAHGCGHGSSWCLACFCHVYGPWFAISYSSESDIIMRRSTLRTFSLSPISKT